MEFKFMLVGTTFYGNIDKFEQKDERAHGKNEEDFYKYK